MNAEKPVSILSTLSIPLASEGALPLLGQSAGLKRVLHLAQKVAPTDSAVLITGETGTGKELLARAIHVASRRAQGPFVAVNAGAIPESLQESELFGHRKGAFTGATADRRGLFEEAGSGTLFLDEIGDTSASMQVKLLRVLQTGSVRRLGEGVERPVDVRVIAATNRPLDQMVARSEFREDLFFRLNVVHLHLPPLRERGEDLDLLLKANLVRFAERLRKDVRAFSPRAWDALTHYFFPGNIRELENIVHHAVLMADGTDVDMADLPPYLTARLALPAPSAAGQPPPGAPLDVPREAWQRPSAAPQRDQGSYIAPSVDLGDGFLSLMDMEKQLIRATLERLKGNQSVAARKLGISRSTLWRKMKEYGLEA
ncbi:MAG TPA: sigma-54 dependent transcriptional regulator [bacterium]|jgi:two-component system response regulator AtoC|nr:sigma-54 dependent transcriptional regulator [bacterium]